MKQVFITLFIIQLSIIHGYAQPLKQTSTYTRADTLRGSYGPGRDWWDVQRYDLDVKFNIADSTISGSNEITFTYKKNKTLMQIDLQDPMIIDSIIYLFGGKYQNKHYLLNFTKDGNAYFFNLPKVSGTKDILDKLQIYFHGKPTIANRPPWDGGLIWRKSKDGSPFVSVACQGLGASVWYPCKDHQNDEPDKGASITMTVPDSLKAIANGRQIGEMMIGGSRIVGWEVISPINNYNIVPYIGKYVHFNEVYKGENGNLSMDYWVLEENLEKAKKQFADAARMMKAFEHWFGPYPFYKDGYKLVEAPHLGMEHQSAIAYGNKYENGYLGKDLSGSKNKWGLKWDFIIIHESGHEWFANNITTKDIADMWVHESFTNYSETLFTDYWYGKQAGNEYCTGTRKLIRNDKPIIGTYNVNQEGSGDMYYKGGNMIHTIRQVINDDEKFRQILRGLNKTFYHQTVTTQQIEKYISAKSKINFSKVFDQYLRTTQIPVLEYKLNGFDLEYRYTNCINGFDLPLKINFKGERWINPSTAWKKLSLYPEGDPFFMVDENFYIKTKKVVD